MKKLLIAIIAVLTVGLTSCGGSKGVSKADHDTFTWQYEVEPAVGQGSQGSAIIKVWTYSKDNNTAISQAQKNAVHAILFKGYSGSTDGSRIKGQKPLIEDPNAWKANEEFFKDFFKDGGRYMNYVSMTGNGAIQPGDRIKVGKQYKIGVVVIVQKDRLRKDLEKEGIIKALGNNIF